MRKYCSSIIFFLCFLIVSPILAPPTGGRRLQMRSYERVGQFIGQHSGKIFIASGLTLVGGGIIFVRYANNRINEVMFQAGIVAGSPDYYTARHLLIDYGFLGIDRGIDLMVHHEDAKLVTGLTVNKIGKALAIFWNVKQIELASRLGAKGIGAAVKKGASKLEKIGEKTIHFISKYF